MRQRSDGWGEVANSLCDAGSVGEQKKNSLSSTTVDCPQVSGMRVSFSSFLKSFFTATAHGIQRKAVSSGAKSSMLGIVGASIGKQFPPAQGAASYA